LYQLFGITATAIILCGTASVSALEELIISVSSKELNRNIKGLFFEGAKKE
jgi:CDP-diacylglycerol--glycerol-3-phosphate 3-phosphatidyltransferase